MYRLTRAERETTINWNMEQDTATIDTADPATIRKLDRLAEAFPEVYRCTGVDIAFQAKMYEVPTRYIRFGKPASEARREASRRTCVFSSANAHISG